MPTTEELDNDDYRLRRLFEGYVFHIPDYQRFYSWSTQQCEDLWDDLQNTIGEDNRHYMGTIILKEENRSVNTKGFGDDYRKYAIVDGQQRFTTLILLLKAIVAAFEDLDRDLAEIEDSTYEEVRELAEEAHSEFVRDSSIDDTSFGTQSKLRLQREDHNIYESILQGEMLEEQISKPSERRLSEAHDFYEEKLRSLGEKHTQPDFLNYLGRLLSAILALEFMVYVVESQARATLIFESVNDRGKDLSRLDKTKSFLMHKHYLSQPEEPTGVNPKDRTEVTGRGIRNRFGSIYRSMQTIEEQDRTSEISEDQVQRYHYISQIRLSVNRRYLFEETDRQNTLKAGAPVYLDVLKWHFNRLYNDASHFPHNDHPRNCVEEIDWYTRSLKRYYSRLATIGTYDKDEDLSWELSKLFALGRVGNFYPLLLTVWDQYEEGEICAEELHEILQTIEIASFRIYAIGNKRADTGRSRFYKLANSVARQETGADGIVSNLKGAVNKYEDGFEETLCNQEAYDVFSNRDLRYLLYSYDLYIRHESGGGAPPEIEKAVQNAGRDYSLDHIWAQDATKLNLGPEGQAAHEELVDSLGNLTLTTGRRNSTWRNDPYEEKRTDERYYDSDFASTRKVARDYETWGRSAIESRLDDVVEYAVQRWSLDPEERKKYAGIKPPA